MIQVLTKLTKCEYILFRTKVVHTVALHSNEINLICSILSFFFHVTYTCCAGNQEKHGI